MKRQAEEKQKDIKGRIEITREEVRGIFEMYIGDIGKQYDLDITDVWDPKWPAYRAKQITGCWYLVFRDISDGCAIGPSGLAAMSKESGKIIYSAKLDQY